MNDFFDYIFYRVYRQYEKWKENYPFPFAEGVICVIQGYIVLDILTLLSILNLFPRHIENLKYYVAFPFLAIYLLNHYRYKRKYIDILNKYNALQDKNRKRNGVLIVLLIIVCIGFPLIIGYLRNNLGINI